MEEVGFWAGKEPELQCHKIANRMLISDSPNTHDRLLRDLVRETGYAFVFPYYTPAPDARYPTQIEESYAVLDWIAKNGASKGLKIDKFAIAGDSVGGKHI